ncbi:MAG: flagellar hook-length control protein FliK [Zoogloeaceae bacterium]|jgi:hypothetical protein|nr:flagellar hook-length control protein FliK [Zoogloeaceae bacterium]
MIPTEVADATIRSRLIKDLLTQPAPAATISRVTDALNDFAPGQRLQALIQALLPNGAYRASVGQRDVTLALPFSAKPGDTLELEVVENKGRIALAVVAGDKGEAKVAAENTSVATRFSTAGRLIGDLLAGLESGKRPQPAPLNGAQPVLPNPPAAGGGQELAAALKGALAKSGMFYEAHQARWVEGKMSLQTLLQEPQGRLSPAAHALTHPATAQPAATQPAAAQPNTATPNAVAPNAATANAVAPNVTAPNNAAPNTVAAHATTAALDTGAVRVGMSQMVASNLTTLVQQQLEALATHCYVWQGQIWPGQNMDWEIVEEDADERERGENTADNWTTRLNLSLPNLGDLAATLRLSGGKEIEISVRAESEAARRRLTVAVALLREQFETVGLKLSAFSVARHVPDHDAAAAA